MLDADPDSSHSPPADTSAVTGNGRIAIDPPSDENEAAGDVAVEEIFGNEDNARAATLLIARFVASWDRHGHERSPEAWLAGELRECPGVWADET